MSVRLPAPVDLSPPPENPGALDELLTDLSGAVFGTGQLAWHLAGPAASAPGWLGADAAAAADQITRTALLAGDMHDALIVAVARLTAHQDLLALAVQRVRALQEEQRADFAVAGQQLAQLQAGGDLALAGPGAVAVVDRLTAAESGRAGEHARLLAEVSDDAAQVAAVLARSSEVVGGRGVPGDGARVVRHLAAQFPGWGKRELADLGTALAGRLTGTATGDELEEFAADATADVSAPAFARALLLGLGTEGVRHLLTVLGEQSAAAPGPLAALLATALRTAARMPTATADEGDPLHAILRGEYVDAGDPDRVADEVVVGMGAVLLAGGSAVPATAVAGWGTQMLARERAQGASAMTRLGRPGPDPVVLVIDDLAHVGDPAAAAQLLSVRSSWDALLQRSWGDGAAALSAVVAAAGLEPGATGDEAVRGGLAALGTGVTSETGGQWTVDRATAARVADALGNAAAAHLDVVTDLLAAGLVSAGPTVGDDAALRGLGYLTVDDRAARAIDDALVTWARQLVPAVPLPGPLPLTGATALGSYLAVREYGQRVAYALHGAQEMANAVDRQINWTFLVTLPTIFLRGAPQGIVSILSDAGARYFRADGTWDNGPDTGAHYDRREAAAAATAASGRGDADTAAEATAAFDRIGRILGTPHPPDPTAPDLLDTKDLVEQKRDQFRERLTPAPR